MALTTDKLKAAQELPEIKRVKSDPSNLHISRDEFIAKRRRDKEKEARLKLASAEIERELEEEEKAVKKVKKAKKVELENTEEKLNDE